MQSDSFKGGYWGDITASRDWCEVNYQVFPFIAEFWNTISNAAYIFAGLNILLQYYRFKNHLSTSYLTIPLCLIGLGIGSAAFHATLLWWPQKGDQLFCLFPFIGIFRAISVESNNASLISTIFPIVAHMSLAATILFVVTMVTIVFFEIYMVCMVLYTLYHSYNTINECEINYNINIERKSKKKKKFELNNHGLRCCVAFGMGVFVWVTERILCNELRKLDSDYNAWFVFNPQLHAWWHIFTALGFHEAGFVVMFVNLYKTSSLEPKFIELVTNNSKTSKIKRIFCGWAVGLKARVM